jgi:hypothetical protein
MFVMLFDRQRLLLTLLDAVGEPVGHTDFQKLLFHFRQECEVAPGYDFVPYKFGAYSFTFYAGRACVAWMTAAPARREAATIAASTISASVAPALRALPLWISMQ